MDADTIATWSLDELASELDDISAACDVAARDLVVLRQTLVDLVMSIVAVYGQDRVRWPAASEHWLRETETEIADGMVRFAELNAIKRELAATIRKR